MKVLVIDDEKDIRTLLCDSLGCQRIETIEAGTGAEAIALATDDPPDLAVIDIELPDISGWKVCERLKKNPRTRKIPLIIQSGSIGRETEALAKSFGADHWISKPYDCRTVVELIKHTLST